MWPELAYIALLCKLEKDAPSGQVDLGKKKQKTKNLRLPHAPSTEQESCDHKFWVTVHILTLTYFL